MADRLEGQGEMMVRRQLSLELELQELRGAVAGSEGSRTPAALPSEGETRLPGDELLDRARALAGTGLTLEQHEQVDRILALARELRSDQDAGLATSD